MLLNNIQKMSNLSSFTPHHVVPNLFDFLLWNTHKKIIIIIIICPHNESGGVPKAKSMLFWTPQFYCMNKNSSYSQNILFCFSQKEQVSCNL